MARLLPAEGEAAGPHRLEDVAVTDRGLLDPHARGGHRLVQAEVAHHRGDEGVLCQPPLLAQRDGQQAEDLVAVDDLAGVVDREAAVGVAVDGEAGVGPVLEHGLPQRGQVGRAAAGVDVEPVGAVPDRDDPRAGGGQRLRAGLVRSTVGAVEHHGEAVEAHVEGVDEVSDVVGDRRGVRRHPAHVRAGRQGHRGVHGRLDVLLHRVVELVPPAAEQLDAVVGHRVVACGDHHTEVGCQVVGEVGDARGRHHAQPQHVDAGRGQPRHDGVLEELPRDARVAAHDGQRTPAVDLADEHARGGLTQTQSEVRGQVAVGETADPVRAEESSHCWTTSISASRTEAPCGPSSDRPSCARSRGRRGSADRPSSGPGGWPRRRRR